MNSSNNSTQTLIDYLEKNDFTEIAKQARANAKRKIEEEKQNALNPQKNAELEAAEQKGYARGLTDGKEQALPVLRSEMEQHLQEIKKQFDSLSEIKTHYAQQIETKATELISAVVHHIMQDIEHQFKEELLAAALKQALFEIEAGTKLILHIHPESKKYITTEAGHLIEDWQVEWVEDTSLNPGDCFIDWDTGGFDLRCDKRMKEIYSLVQNALSNPLGVSDTEQEASLPPHQPDASEPAENMMMSEEDAPLEMAQNAQLSEETDVQSKQAPQTQEEPEQEADVQNQDQNPS